MPLFTYSLFFIIIIVIIFTFPTQCKFPTLSTLSTFYSRLGKEIGLFVKYSSVNLYFVTK